MQAATLMKFYNINGFVSSPGASLEITFGN